MAGELTVSERILYHLSNYVKFEDKYEVPFDITQDGISQACMISRAHAAIELKKLKALGVLQEKLSHVRRGKARRKVYFLTHDGKARAANVIQYTKDSQVNPMVDPSKISSEGTLSRGHPARKSSAFPTVKEFYGREKELESLRASLATPSVKVICVKGIAGIGKTTLVAKLCSDASNSRIFWHTARSWDAPRTLEEGLARFFADNGSRKLASYLSSGKTELGELSFLLNEELGEDGYMFVFDDVDRSESLQDFLRMFKHSSGSAKVIVTAECESKFYEPSDVVARKEVMELELGGLGRTAALKLLESRGIEGEVAEELVSVTNGHPLSLEMVTASTPTEARYQVSRFLEEKFYSVLTESERYLLQLASVFEKPFPADAIPRELRQARRGSMLREVAPGMFEIHATLKEFVYGSMTKEEKATWHSAAADHYLKTRDLQDRLVHLVKAGRTLEAEMLVARSGEQMMEEGNVQLLWEVLSSFASSKPKYKNSVDFVRARAAILAGKFDHAWSILETLSGSDDLRTSSEALVEMGRIRSKEGDLEASTGFFSEALEKTKDLPRERAKALCGLGVVERKAGNHERAEKLLEKSALDAMAVMDQKGMLLAHMELGNVFIDTGNYEKAIEHFSKCAAGFGAVELTNVYTSMGIANAHLGRFDEARLHLENAVRLAEDTGQPRSKAQALRCLAEAQTKTGRIDQAKESCFAALDIAMELDDRRAMSAIYSTLGKTECVGEDFGASEEYFQESIRAIESLGVPRMLGLRKMEYGLMMIKKGDSTGARAILEDARDLLSSIRAAELVDRIDEELSRLT